MADADLLAMGELMVELSPSQAARRLGLSRQRVVQLCDAGKLPCRRTALGRLIPAEAVEALALEREHAHIGAHIAEHNSRGGEAA